MKFPISRLMAAAAVYTAIACVSGASAQTQPPPEVQALINAPDIRNGLAAIERRDFRTAASLLRSAANRGNPLAQVVLAKIYFYGDGVPRNKQEALRLVAVVEPTATMAFGLLKRFNASLRASGDPRDQQLAMATYLLPLVNNPTLQKFRWSPPSGGGFMEGWIAHGLTHPDSDE